MAERQTMKINAKITPYSTAVGPSVVFSNRRIFANDDFMAPPVFEIIGPSIQAYALGHK
jgi:hypothetical protein